MIKRTQKENIAVAIALVGVLAVSPIFFASSFTNPFVSTADTVASQQIADNFNNSHDVVFIQKPSGFEVTDFVTGYGKTAESGDTVYVHYVGQLEDGELFDNSTSNPTPFEVTLGSEEVIQGWDIGLVGMKEGGTRRLVIPPQLGYGDFGIVDTDGIEIIPGNATLVFDVVLLKVK